MSTERRYLAETRKSDKLTITKNGHKKQNINIIYLPNCRSFCPILSIFWPKIKIMVKNRKITIFRKNQDFRQKIKILVTNHTFRQNCFENKLFKHEVYIFVKNHDFRKKSRCY